MRTTSHGHPMCTFSIAENQRYTNQNGERVELTTWYSCATYRRQAEVAFEHLKRAPL